MSGDDGARGRADGPLAQFNFLVDFGGGSEAGFQEVGGLDGEMAAIEYRHSKSPTFSTLKMPGIAKSGTVTLKRGLLAGDDGFWDWHRAIELGRIEPRTISIRLLDEARRPVATWTLAKAWPTKLTGAAPRPGAGAVPIEALELAHEGIAMGDGDGHKWLSPPSRTPLVPGHTSPPERNFA